MISNPCRWFVTGSKEKQFTYEGGSTLFHFSPHDSGLSKSLDANIVFFAENETHALDVLKRMLRFRIDCAAEYIAHNKGRGKGSPHSEEFIETAMTDNANTVKYLEAIESGLVKVSPAPTNQFYKVGWACNDNILH